MELSLIGQCSKSFAFALCDKQRKIKARESEKLRNILSWIILNWQEFKQVS